jgi:hypothetical protein
MSVLNLATRRRRPEHLLSQKPDACRQRRTRARKDADRASFRIEADYYPLASFLEEKGFLETKDMDDRAKVTAALQRFVAETIRYM